MTPEEVKDYINHALASSRGLTSDLASDIVKKMEGKIKESIEVTVNGKINKLTEIVLEQKELSAEHRQLVVLKLEDNEKRWTEATPILDTMQKQQNFFSVGGAAMKGFILVGAVISAIVGAVHYIKEWINQ
jgi:hypothetical protein